MRHLNSNDGEWKDVGGDQFTFTRKGADFFSEPPVKPGYEVYFVARHGHEYTTWTYRRSLVPQWGIVQ